MQSRKNCDAKIYKAFNDNKNVIQFKRITIDMQDGILNKVQPKISVEDKEIWPKQHNSSEIGKKKTSLNGNTVPIILTTD